MNPLDAVNFNPKLPSNINYAKAREAIDQVFKCRAQKRKAKMICLEELGGTKKSGIKTKEGAQLPAFVLFSDGTKARF